MQLSLAERCHELLVRLGIAAEGEEWSVEPLRGGVASDIAVVAHDQRRLVAKFALEKLRVAEDWHAPVDRNAAEYAWLEFAGHVLSGAAPRLYGRDATLNGFVMEYVQEKTSYLWKSALLARQSPRDEARLVGDTLGALHAASTLGDVDRAAFQNQVQFEDLRLEPYLAFTATVHPDRKEQFAALMESQRSNQQVLIHGDISPKNIIFRERGPVFLDAECATAGDPSFDVAFCLNHLLLKAFHMPDRASELMRAVRDLWAAYVRHVCWEKPAELEGRVIALLPALMLARVDGKSPVEYLSEATRQQVRQQALALLGGEARTLVALTQRLKIDTEGAAA